MNETVSAWVKQSDFAEMVDSTLANGGGTFNLDATPHPAEIGYYCAISGHELVVPVDAFSEGIVRTWVDVAQPEPDKLIGTWVHQEEVYLDVSKYFLNEHQAMQYAQEGGEKAIWDIAKNQAIFLQPDEAQAPSTMAKVAAWTDLMQKAQRLRGEGRVHILQNTMQHVVGRVEGDHGTYTTQIWRQAPNSRGISMWDCECPWDQYAWQRTRQWQKYEGRPCSHALALFWQSLSTPLDEGTDQYLPGQAGGPMMGQPGQGQLFDPGAQAPRVAPAPQPFNQNLPFPMMPRVPEQQPPGGTFSPMMTPPPPGSALPPMPGPGGGPLPGPQPGLPPLRVPPGGGATSQPQKPGEGGQLGFPGAFSHRTAGYTWRDFEPGEFLEVIVLQAPRKQNYVCNVTVYSVTGENLNVVNAHGQKRAIPLRDIVECWGPDDPRRYTKTAWTAALISEPFQNGDIVRANVSLTGLDRDGRQWRVPKNSKGEVLASNELETVVIFPLKTGQMQPHLVKVITETGNLSASPGSPFIRRR